MEKRRNLYARSARDKTDIVELTKTINKKKQRDVRQYNMAKLNEALVSDTISKSFKRNLGAGKNKMYVARQPNDELIYNRLLKISIADVILETPTPRTDMKVIPMTLNDGSKEALNSMKSGPASGKGGISVELIKIT